MKQKNLILLVVAVGCGLLAAFLTTQMSAKGGPTAEQAERMLRDKFENDDALHAPQRHAMEVMRERLLAARLNGGAVANLLTILKEGHSNQVSETSWELGARPPGKETGSSPDDLEIKKRFGPKAQILSSPQREKDRKFYFEDLPRELQRVLRIQLRQAGDVSAVIEMPSGFALYVATEKTSEQLAVAVLSLSKRSYEEWLAEQSKE